MAAGAQPAAFAHDISALPDKVLGTVLALAKRPAVALVCKRWRQLFYSEPQMWHNLTVTFPDGSALSEARLGDWFRSQQALVQRVAPLVAAAELIGPAALLQNEVNSWRLATVLRALLRLPQLRALVVRLSDQRLPAATAAELAAWTALQQLEIEALELMARDISSIASLSQLTRLDLQTDLPLPAAALLQLTGLRQLQQLELQELEAAAAAEGSNFGSGGGRSSGRAGGGLWVLPPAAFPQLCLQTYGSPCIQVGAGRLSGTRLADFRAAATLQAKRSCSSGKCGSADDCTLLDGSSCRAGGTPGWEVSIASVDWEAAGTPNLQALLVAMGASSPTELHLAASQLAPAPFQLSHQLAALTELEISECTATTGADSGGNAGSTLQDALQPLLAALPQLKLLVLEGDRAIPGSCNLSAGLPSSLRQLTGLAGLECRGCQLATLPDGDYLQGVLWLDLSWNSFARLPPALAAATSLCRLRMDGNASLVLTTADVDTILLPMLGLQQLELGRVAGPGWVLEHLAERRPFMLISQ